ncbi:MAG: BtrH N-terminal domain-containing protein [Anaerolineae bacterium]
MHTKLPNFTHIVGWHCSSTSISNAAKFDGVPMSEAMAFGLGAGLGFQYWDIPANSPRYSFNGRSSGLERKFFNHIGQPAVWAAEWSPEKMADALANGRPILCVTDIYGLPYYQPQVHFPGHGVVVAGINTDTEEVDLADIASPELLTVHWDHLKASMSENRPPMIEPFQWMPAPVLDASVINEKSIRAAIKTAADFMLRSDHPEEGLHVMPKMIEEMGTKWAKEESFAWTARFGYQAIEKRGSGGGGFRKLYAHFLEEAAEFIPTLSTSGAIAEAFAAAELWTVYSGTLKQIFIQNDPSLFTTAAQEQLSDILAAETALLEKLDQLV